MTTSIPHGMAPEPIDGSRIRVTVSVDGKAVMDADLTHLCYTTRYAALDEYGGFLPVWFVPNTYAEEGQPYTPAEPVHAILSLRVTAPVPAAGTPEFRTWFRALPKPPGWDTVQPDDTCPCPAPGIHQPGCIYWEPAPTTDLPPRQEWH